MQPDLFAAQPLPEGVLLLRGFADAKALAPLIEAIWAQSPPRVLLTPGGKPMAARMTNCGARGWVSDRRGYRYEKLDPLSGRTWPAMPPAFRALATSAAAAAGFAGFDPDACLINAYPPGAGMSLHQDRDERDFTQPIVSVSLGLPATFLFGGATRAAKPRPIPLAEGDVIVWGGPARLYFHGVKPPAPGTSAHFGAQRVNLTFRQTS